MLRLEDSELQTRNDAPVGCVIGLALFGWEVNGWGCHYVVLVESRVFLLECCWWGLWGFGFFCIELTRQVLPHEGSGANGKFMHLLF